MIAVARNRQRPQTLKSIKTVNHKPAKIQPLKTPLIDYSTKAHLTFTKIDYSEYVPRNLLDSETENWESLFQGLIHYIVFRSQNTYNAAELRLGFTSIQTNSDPANILDYRSSAAFQAGFGLNPFLLIEFKRVEVCPVAYTFCIGPQFRTGHCLQSFVFQAFGPSGNWITLDERHMLFVRNRAFTCRIFYIDSDCYYTTFRLMATDASDFSLTAFDIHGPIHAIDDNKSPEEVEDPENDMDDMNPWDLPDFE
jgi:hypothetical protein